MQAVVSLGDLKRVAKTLKELPPKDFQKYLEQAGLVTEANNDKAALVLGIVEHIFEDVLQPAAGCRNPWREREVGGVFCLCSHSKW